jgi:NAD(P)H dehydrogenase (quinone)
MPDFRNAPILVTGASGHLGRLAVEELLRRGATNVTAGSRDPSKLNLKGVKTARVDFDDAASLEAAFKGIERVLMISTDALVPGRREVQHVAAVEAAKRAGVAHVVYTSMPSPEPGSPLPIAPDHYAAEQALKASGMGYTIMRHNWYFENLLMGMPSAIASGALYTSAGTGQLAQGARADYAAADAGALLTEASSATYDAGGPEAQTMDEVAGVFNEVLGTAIKVVQLDDAALTGGLTAAGLPEGLVGLLVGADRAIRDGRMGQVTGAVERLAGRKPQTLKAWLTANRAMFPVAATA